MRRVWWLILCGMIFLHDVGRAEALSCTANMGTPVTFSGLDILSGAPVNAASTLSVTCTVSTLDGLVGALLTVSICPDIGEGTGGSTGGVRQLALNPSDKLLYNIYQDSNRQVPWGHGDIPALGTVPVMTMTVTVPLLGTASNTVSRDVYFQLNGSQQTAPTGTYTSNFSGTHTRIRAGIGLLSVCSGLFPATTTAPFLVQATIDKNCTVTTQGVNFGNVGLLNSDIDAEGRVRVTCTKSTDYSVGLGFGALTPTTRQMKKGTDVVVYGLYRDIARTLGWGDTAGLMPTGTGTGLTESYPVYGRVKPQPNPPVGTYNDLVPVIITY